jgi:two-component system response regulator QseB
MHIRLLLIEDDEILGETVCKDLRQNGFAVDWVRDARADAPGLDSGAYDLLLLDLGMPRKSGLEVLKSIRQKGNPVPVLVLTARDAVSDRVLGLNSGADDYLTKPFDTEELVARINVLLRRRAGYLIPKPS